MRKNSHGKVLVGCLAMGLVFLPARKSHAAANTVPILLKTLAETVGQSLHLTEILDTSIKVVGMLNEVAAATRTLVRLGNQLANYTPEEFLQDALVGIEGAYPELGGLRREVDELVANGKGLEDGSFFRRYGRHDARTDRAAVAYSKALTHSALVSVMGLKRKHSRKLSPVQEKILERAERTGAAAQVVFDQSALGGFAREVKALREAARNAAKSGEGSLKEQLLAEMMVADFSLAESATRMLQLDAQDVAEREAARQENEKRLKVLQKDFLEGEESLLKPTWGRFPEE